MIAAVLVFAVLPALLIAAALWDVASYTIPNLLQAALLAAFAIFVVAVGMSPMTLGYHLLAGCAALVAGFVLFSLGYIGGGDAKLFACVAVWLGLHDLSGFAIYASFFGGGLTLGLLAFRKLPLPPFLCRQKWLLRLHDQKGGIPYGAALAAGAFVVLPYTDVFRMGVAA